MQWIDAALLGLIQGIGEFLPISSSGHLVLARAWFGSDRIPQNLAYDALLHLATSLSVIVVFRREVMSLIRAAPKLLAPSRWTHAMRSDAHFRTLVLVLLSAIPALVVGLTFKKFLEHYRERPDVVSLVLILTGIWLLVASRFRAGTRELGTREAMAMGGAQALSVFFPGFSRSGATIGTGLLCGVRREIVGPFAFLMSLPPNLGAAALKGKDVFSIEGSVINYPTLIVGSLVAFAVGVAALRWLLPFVRRGSLRPFGFYCLALGLVSTCHLVLHVF